MGWVWRQLLTLPHFLSFQGRAAIIRFGAYSELGASLRVPVLRPNVLLNLGAAGAGAVSAWGRQGGRILRGGALAGPPLGVIRWASFFPSLAVLARRSAPPKIAGRRGVPPRLAARPAIIQPSACAVAPLRGFAAWLLSVRGFFFLVGGACAVCRVGCLLAGGRSGQPLACVLFALPEWPSRRLAGPASPSGRPGFFVPVPLLSLVAAPRLCLVLFPFACGGGRWAAAWASS